MDQTVFQLISNDTIGTSITEFSFSMCFLGTSQELNFQRLWEDFVTFKINSCIFWIFEAKKMHVSVQHPQIRSSGRRKSLYLVMYYFHSTYWTPHANCKVGAKLRGKQFFHPQCCSPTRHPLLIKWNRHWYKWELGLIFLIKVRFPDLFNCNYSATDSIGFTSYHNSHHAISEMQRKQVVPSHTNYCKVQDWCTERPAVKEEVLFK